MNLKRRNQRTRPFLQQNWITGVAAVQKNSVMGVNLSTPKHLSGQDDGAPPQKRIRLSSPDPLENDRYASHETSESRSALRVEVLKVLHKDSKKVRPLQTTVMPRDIVTIKGRCRITVSDVSEGFPHILYCCCKNCDIITYKNPVGPHRVARVDLPQPFLVPEESIRVNRHDDVSNDFAQSYRLDVELESINDGTWPPLEPYDFGIPLGEQSPLSDKRRWIFHTEVGGVFGRSKTPVHLTTGHRPERPSRSTDYVMDVDLRWTAGFRPIAKGSKPCITAIDPDAEPYTTGQLEPIPDDQLNGVDVLNGVNGADGADGANGVSEPNGVNGVNGINGANGINGVGGDEGVVNGVNGVNGINGHAHEDSSHEPDDDVEGDQTPNRALRRGGAKQYNLKILSDKAQGKERKPRARAAQATQVEGRVTYFTPVDQPVCLDYWRCISCGTFHDSLPQLQLHLQTVHVEFDYVLDMTSQGPNFRVSHRMESVGTPTKTYQLGKPVRPFYLDSNGVPDAAWLAARIGPDNNEESARSPSKQATSRQLFDSKPVLAAQPAPPAPPPEARPKKRKITIPETSHPLFDPVSKARLVAGEDLPKSAIDGSWLIQKHREDIGEFSDVTAEEKEYIRNWDAFILQENVTSGAYFPRAWLKFVKEHASWLVTATPRMVEFGKHMGVLMARDVLDDKSIDDAMVLFDEARAQLKARAKEQANGAEGPQTADTTLKQSPRASQIMKGPNGCTVCQLPVLGPSLLVCSNKNCSSRLYHAGCVQQTAISPAARAKWLCNECSKSGGSS